MPAACTVQHAAESLHSLAEFSGRALELQCGALALSDQTTKIGDLHDGTSPLLTAPVRVTAWSYHISSLGSSCRTSSGIFLATAMIVA